MHGKNLVAFTNDSRNRFNKSLNFSFMHSVFAMLLEVEAFQ